MVYKGTQVVKNHHVVTKRQEQNSTYLLQLSSKHNRYLPFPDPTHSIPYHYTYPYVYPYPYTYYSSPYYPPYSYIPAQQGYGRANFQYQSMASRDIKIREQPCPVEIKIELRQQPQPEDKPAQKTILSHKKKQGSGLKHIGRKDYKKKDYQTNPQIIQIFSRLIRTFISQDSNLIKEKLEVQKCLKKTQQIPRYDEFFQILFQCLRKKFAQFRKTKEEMIKYIIRRAYQNQKSIKGAEYRAELDRLQQFHQKNLSLYKSMNNDFLRKQFSNKLFVEIYKEFVDQMDEQFQKENEERIQRLAFLLTYSWYDKNLKLITHEKKFPWNMNYKRKVKKIAYDLLQQFQPLPSENKQKTQIQ